MELITRVDILSTVGPVTAHYLTRDGEQGEFVDLPIRISLADGQVLETTVNVLVINGQFADVPEAQFKGRIAKLIDEKLRE